MGRGCDAEGFAFSRPETGGEGGETTMDAAERATLKQQVEGCIEAFRRGELTEASLQRLLEPIEGGKRRRQDLLYLQTHNTSLQAPVRGMMIVRDGELWEGPEDAREWPYQCVLDAIRDGWRVIQFPDLALLMDETRAGGLGCEFVLERYEGAR
jgi:hypothetical protein